MLKNLFYRTFGGLRFVMRILHWIPGFIVAVMFVTIAQNSVLSILYDVDPSLFIATFCRNTDRPELHCNGKCRLAEMQREESRQQAKDLLKQLSEIPLFIAAGFTKLPELPLIVAVDRRPVSFNPQDYNFLYADKSFRPPC